MSDLSHDDIKEIEERLTIANQKLRDLVPQIAKAETLIELLSDHKKNILSDEQKRFIERGESAAGAEVLARSSHIYREKLKELQGQLEDALSVRFEWKKTMTHIDSLRSLLARARETMHIFKE